MKTRYNTGYVFETPVYGVGLPPADLMAEPIKLRRIKFEKAIQFHPYVATLLNEVPMINGFNYTFVDIKVQHLVRGQPTEVVGPHIDFRMEPVKKGSFELNHLWASHAPTVFSSVNEPLDPSDRKTFQQKAKQSYYSAKPRHWYTYDRHQIHWGPVVQRPTKRLFLRVSQTMENFR
jgi:hypothetical protein